MKDFRGIELNIGDEIYLDYGMPSISFQGYLKNEDGLVIRSNNGRVCKLELDENGFLKSAKKNFSSRILKVS